MKAISASPTGPELQEFLTALAPPDNQHRYYAELYWSAIQLCAQGAEEPASLLIEAAATVRNGSGQERVSGDFASRARELAVATFYPPEHTAKVCQMAGGGQ